MNWLDPAWWQASAELLQAFVALAGLLLAMKAYTAWVSQLQHQVQHQGQHVSIHLPHRIPEDGLVTDEDAE